MDELIILIIRALVRGFGGERPAARRPSAPTWSPAVPPPRPPGPGRTMPAPVRRGPVPAGFVPVNRRPPVATRRPGRPGQPTQVAIAEPILTLTAQDLAEATAPVPKSPPGGRRSVAGRATMANKGSTAAASPAGVLRQRLTPAMLRQQIVLSEILQPPLGLRDGH